MTKKLAFPAALTAVLAAFALLILLPEAAAEGARRGLGVCAGTIVPALLPFLIFSGLLSALGVPHLLAKAAGPCLHRLGLSPYAAAPLFLGLTGGYPVGAAAVGSLVRDGQITPEDAARLLPWCNNTGPAFIVGVAGSAVFHSVRGGLMLYLCHILAALLLALWMGRTTSAAAPPAKASPPASLARALPECVKSAAAATVNICAFVVFFSVLTSLLRAVGILAALAALPARWLGTGLQWATALLTGLLELGSGIGAMAGLPATPGNLALAAFLLGFGGLSVHCQTLAVLGGTDVKCARHFVGRIAHGCISAALAFLLFSLIPL